MPAGWAAWVAFRAAWSCLRHHRLRSVLTLTMCGLGTAGVIVAGVLAQAHKAEVEKRFRTLGGGLVIVSPNKVPPYPGRPRQLDHFISLEPEDATALSKELPDLRAVVPVVARNTTVRLGASAARVRLVGTGPEYLQVRSFQLAHGRFFAPADSRERVLVLGHAVSEELQPGGVRPGQEVTLAAIPYRVIGILQPHGVNFAGEDEDHQVFLPLDTYCQRIANRPWLNYLYLQMGPEADLGRTLRRVHEFLRKRHGRWPEQVDDVIVRDLADVTARQSNLLATTLWAVSVTSGLLVVMGSIGITTLLGLVVRQRRSEIALRRALGATPRDIALQFFLEGIGLATTGVLAGLLVGSGAALAAGSVSGSPVRLDAAVVALSVAISLGSSAAACTIPAILAARTEPGVVLRG